MTNRTELLACAPRLDLDVFTWSPGDGPTRYRFARAGRYQDYFECESIHSFTATGLAEADSMLIAFTASQQGWLDD